jgi:uncharacterized protein DUF4178
MPELSCPACQRILRPHPNCGTESIVCGACHAIVSLKNGHAQLAGRQSGSVDSSLGILPLKLGESGVIRGKQLTVIGIIKRADGEYAWFEYALADPAGDVSWLWIDRGHFSLCVAEGRDCVTRDSLRHYIYKGRGLKQFNQGHAKFIAAIGEFPFQLDPKEDATITDYIAPPYAASFESGVWWVFEYIPHDEVLRAFPLVKAPEGIGINQPSGFQSQRRTIGLILLLAFAALISVHVLGRGDPSSTLLNAEVDLSRPKDAPVQSLGQITLTRAWNALMLDISSPVNNAWTDLDVELVSDETGKTFWTSGGVEFNTGVDEDGAWSEGSQSSKTVVRSIPAGTYTVLAKASTGSWNAAAPAASAQLRVSAAGAPVGNLAMEIVLLLLATLPFIWTAHRFERRRWELSDFSP